MDDYYGNIGAKTKCSAFCSHEHFAKQNVLVKRLNPYRAQEQTP